MRPHTGGPARQVRGTFDPARPERPTAASQAVWPPGPAEWKWWDGLTGFAAGHVAAVALIVAAGLALHAAGVHQAIGVSELLLVLVLAAAAVGFARRRKQPRSTDFGLRPAPSRASVGWVALGYVTYLILAGIYVAAIHNPHATTHPLLPHRLHGIVPAAAVIISLVIVAPVGEEFFYRGFLYAALRNRLAIAWATLIAGGAFGLMHFVLGGDPLLEVPVLATLGCIQCLLYEKTRSLYPTIAMHAVVNGIAGSVLIARSPVPALIGCLLAAALFLLAPWRLRGPAARPPASPDRRRGLVGTSA